MAKPLRYDTNALLCAIAGYPAKGCGEQVAGGQESAAAGQKEETSDGGPALGLVAGIAVVAVLGAAGVWQARRRRHA